MRLLSGSLREPTWRKQKRLLADEVGCSPKLKLSSGGEVAEFISCSYADVGWVVEG